MRRITEKEKENFFWRNAIFGQRKETEKEENVTMVDGRTGIVKIELEFWTQNLQ